MKLNLNEKLSHLKKLIEISEKEKEEGKENSGTLMKIQEAIADLNTHEEWIAKAEALSATIQGYA